MNAKIEARRRNRNSGNNTADKAPKSHTRPVRAGRIRAGVSLVLLSVLLGACSSVPNAINPVKWYEKTTNFFSGDAQAANSASVFAESSQKAQNKGLSADANAPAPAPSVVVAAASGGLNADSGSDRQYAGPALKRQGAPRDILQPEETVSVAPSPMPVEAPVQEQAQAVPQEPAPRAQPPAPRAQPTVQVMSAPVAPRENMTPRDEPPSRRASVPARPTFAARPSSPPAPPANAVSPFGEEPFKTVVISADGLDSVPADTSVPVKRNLKFTKFLKAAKPQGPLFPKPGETVQRNFGADRVGGMLRVATIHFANNSDRLDGRDRSILGAVIQLQRERGGRVIVVGHASRRTRDMNFIRHQMVNFKISMERADTVGNALQAMGLRNKLLEVQAVSDSKPLYLEVMPSGEAGNRRVEVYLAP